MRIVLDTTPEFDEAIRKHVEFQKETIETPEGTLTRKKSVEQHIREQFWASMQHLGPAISSPTINQANTELIAAQKKLDEARKSTFQVSIDPVTAPSTEAKS